MRIPAHPDDPPGPAGGPAPNGVDPHVQAVLQARADLLARPVAEERTGASLSLLFFSLGAERYAVPIQRVEGVEAEPTVVPIPGTPPHWMGLINRQSQVIPVLHLAHWLGLSHADGPDQGTVILVTMATGWTVGLWVDAVEASRAVFEDELRPPLGRQRSTLVGGIRGLTPDLAAVLDLDRLLPPDRLQVDQRRGQFGLHGSPEPPDLPGLEGPGGG